MRRIFGVTLAAASALGWGSARGDEAGAKAVLDRAIKAIGGEEAIRKAGVVSWKTEGTIRFGGNENKFTGRTTVKGLDHSRSEFEGEFGGNTIKGVTVLAGDKGWRKFGENRSELGGDEVAHAKRTLYLQIAPTLLVPLKGEGFKIATAPDEEVGGKPAAALKVTGPDGKDFTLLFDKESGLPVKMVAVVPDFQGEEYTQESSFSDYKEFDGIKKATKLENRRDGERFVEAEVVEFKALDEAPEGAFAEPE